MGERHFGHRDVVDKLGIKPGHAVAFDERAAAIDAALRKRVLTRTARPPAKKNEPIDVVLVAVSDGTDAAAILTFWGARLDPAGGVWPLSPKRGRAGYVDQRNLIAAGQTAGLVDNKSCSVDDGTSGMRFVIRRVDRPSRRPKPG